MKNTGFQLNQLKGKLVVSCQAQFGEELHGNEIMLKMALAAQNGGAAGIRADSPEEIAMISSNIDLPVIGLWKRTYPDSEVYITPTLADAQKVALSGATIVAMDATGRPRPNGEELKDIVSKMKSQHSCLLMADISTVEEGIHAAAIGFDMVSTTLSGYTPHSRQSAEPDVELVAKLSRTLDIPVFAEGRIHTEDQVAAMLQAGAFAIVIGGAITKPRIITRRFVEQMEAVTKQGYELA